MIVVAVAAAAVAALVADARMEAVTVGAAIGAGATPPAVEAEMEVTAMLETRGWC